MFATINKTTQLFRSYIPDIPPTLGRFNRSTFFEANPYVPADERTQVADLKYRFEIGTLIQNNSAVHYVLPVHVMAMRKNPPQTLIDAGYENFTFEQLRDEDQYATIPTSIRDKYFARKTYYFSINNSAGAPLSEHATFQPSIWAVYDKPGSAIWH